MRGPSPQGSLGLSRTRERPEEASCSLLFPPAASCCLPHLPPSGAGWARPPAALARRGWSTSGPPGGGRTGCGGDLAVAGTAGGEGITGKPTPSDGIPCMRYLSPSLCQCPPGG